MGHVMRLLLCLVCLWPVGAFLIPARQRVLAERPVVALCASSPSQSDKQAATNTRMTTEESLTVLYGDVEDCSVIPDSSAVYDALKDRLLAMERGIGKRYVTRTQRGFLNVHQEPGDPYNKHNIVGQLREGDVVTSTGPNRGAWIRHDGGGWSISIFGGFTWLEELKE